MYFGHKCFLLLWFGSLDRLRTLSQRDLPRESSAMGKQNLSWSRVNSGGKCEGEGGTTEKEKV